MIQLSESCTVQTEVWEQAWVRVVAVQSTWNGAPVQAEKQNTTESSTWTSRLLRSRGRKPTWPSLTTSAAPAAQSAPVHRTTGTAGQTSDWKLGRQSSVTAFPESTPFKLTIWNILGALQKKKGAAFLDLLFYSPSEKKTLKGQTGPVEKSCWALGEINGHDILQYKGELLKTCETLFKESHFPKNKVRHNHNHAAIKYVSAEVQHTAFMCHCLQM